VDPSPRHLRFARPLRRSVTLLALVPLTILLATRLSYLFSDPVFGLYAAATLTATLTVIYLAFGHYRDPSLDPPLHFETPFVSCLVAVKNEEQVIERCVESLLASDYPNFEVIVVDDGSRDETPALLRMLQARHPNLRVLTLVDSSGKKRALTDGAGQARGEYFFFTDSDCVVAPDAVSRVMRAFAAHPEIGAVSGHARALNAGENFLTKVQDTWYESQFSVWKASESVFGSVTCISGPLAAFRREVIYNFFPAWANDSFLGKEFPFATDRQLTAYALGAPYIGERLKARYSDSHFVSRQDHPCRKWRVEYVKSARAWTVVPRTLPRLLKQQVRWKKSFIRNLFMTGSFQWRRGPMPAALFYLRALFIVLAPAMAFRHLIWLPLHGSYFLCSFYIVGVFLKGSVWAVAYKAENPGCRRWIYRPFMSLMTTFLFSGLLIYSLLTLRRSVWVRG
jgi:cellulose synthase/poly-beta-1,6-N-acetylglucosamine synthase-like glycosyltransferase